MSEDAKDLPMPPIRCRPSVVIALAGAVAWSAPVGPAQAQPIDLDRQVGDALNRLERDAETRRQEVERERRRDTPPQPAPAMPEAAPRAASPQCVSVEKVEIAGWEPFGEAPQEARVLAGRCIGVADIAAAVSDVNRGYQGRGHITSRVYVPAQNPAATGVLKLVVVPGVITGMRYSDGRPADLRLVAAFPTRADGVLDLRRLEQGLDNLNAVPSQKATFKLIPGEKTGETTVEVAMEEKRRWRVSGTLDNSGYKSTGVYKGKLDAAFDGLLGLNDQVSVGLTGNVDRWSGDRWSNAHVSQDYSASYGFSWQEWSFSFGVGRQEYGIDIPGINKTYRADGHSMRGSIGVERLLWRNQTTKTYLWADLTRKSARNFILGEEILTQRRDLTIAGVGLRGKIYAGDTVLEWRGGGRFGLDLFGAARPLGPARQEFAIAVADARLTTPLFGGALVLRSAFAAQWSDDPLPGSELFSVGGRSDVRGFHEEVLSGTSGFRLRNDLERTLWSDDVAGRTAKLTGFVGFDFGRVKLADGVSRSTPWLAGAAVGGRLQLGNELALDLTWSRALHRPNEFKTDADLIHAALTVAY